ncbi:hypothetical protein GGI07_002946 [Coemansia sp. Benny D115]|nr:hypothetical protein GGI07_002946 [Coemansia sp. Benny D115]
MDTEREREATVAAGKIKTSARVLDVAVPANKADADRARKVADAIAASLEKYVKHKSSPASLSAGKSAVTRSKAAINQLDAKHANMWPLLDPKKGFDSEFEMYPCIQELLGFINSQIVEQAKGQGYKPARTLETYKKADRRPEGADDSKRIDLGIFCRNFRQDQLVKADLSEELDDNEIADIPNYSNMLAVIEAKKKTTSMYQREALVQLLLYTRNLYVCQCDRQFAWGFTVCGYIFCAYVVWNDGVFASEDINVRTPEGREKLVTLLCNMSFCEVDQLGYDSSFRYNNEKNRWEIVVFDDREIENDESGQHLYKIDKQFVIADHLFGRHTRCFVARKILSPPAGSSTATGVSTESFGDEVIIKDAWAYAEKAEDGTADTVLRNEVRIIRKIDDKLKDNPDFALMYPVLIHGGVVRSKGGGEKYEVNKDIFHALGPLGPEATMDSHTRVYRRLALLPFAKPIDQVRSVYDLVIAVADAMLVYMEIWKTTKILHRDISDNNILFLEYGGQIRGHSKS